MDMDNWEKYQGMKIDELMNTIQDLNKKLFKMKEGTMVYSQLSSMIHNAEQALKDKMALEKIKGQPGSEVMNIGEIDSTVETPEYSDQELLDVTVQAYLKTLKGKVQK